MEKRLNSLSRPIFSDRTERDQMIQTIETMRGRNALMTLSASQLLGRIADAHMLPARHFVVQHVFEASGTITFCRQHGLTLDPVRFRHVR